MHEKIKNTTFEDFLLPFGAGCFVCSFVIQNRDKNVHNFYVMLYGCETWSLILEEEYTPKSS